MVLQSDFADIRLWFYRTTIMNVGLKGGVKFLISLCLTRTLSPISILLSLILRLFSALFHLELISVVY